MKFVYITDTHRVAPPRRLYGLDPEARPDAAVADIKRHHDDVELVLVRGDLTHGGEPEAYRYFIVAMRPLPMPGVMLIGNHDRGAECLDVLQGVRDFPAAPFIFLNTFDETSHAVQICEFAETPARPPADKPILLVMHHPPSEVGVHAMDRIALAERARFAEGIATYRTHIRHLFFEPVHRPFAGNWQGIPFSTQCGGTYHQICVDDHVYALGQVGS